MSWDWLWKSVAARIVWELLLLFGLNGFLEWLYKKQPQLRAKVQPVLISTACICIILYTLFGRPILMPEPPTISEQNIESYVRTWLDEFGLGVRKVPNDNVIFEYEVTAMDNLAVC
jgi:hypothetical protein